MRGQCACVCVCDGGRSEHLGWAPRRGASDRHSLQHPPTHPPTTLQPFPQTWRTSWTMSSSAASPGATTASASSVRRCSAGRGGEGERLLPVGRRGALVGRLVPGTQLTFALPPSALAAPLAAAVQTAASTSPRPLTRAPRPPSTWASRYEGLWRGYGWAAAGLMECHAGRCSAGAPDVKLTLSLPPSLPPPPPPPPPCQLCYHVLGTPQEEDACILTDPDNPTFMFGTEVTHDGRRAVGGVEPRLRTALC